VQVNLVPGFGAEDGIVVIGTTVEYEVVIVNSGQTVLTTVPLVYTYDPVYLSLTQASALPDEILDDGRLLWKDLTGGGALLPGQATTISLTFQARASTTGLDNKATKQTVVVANALDEYGDSVSSVQTEASIQITAPGLTLSKELSSPMIGEPKVNDEVIFRIRVTNSGDTLLTRISLSDLYDASILEYVGADIGNGTNGTSGHDGIVSWEDITEDLGDLDPGASAEFHVVFRWARVESTTNVVIATSAQDANNDEVPPNAVGAGTADIKMPFAGSAHFLYLPIVERPGTGVFLPIIRRAY
jgi:hypothetical protein